MNDTIPPHEHHRSWVVALTCSALVLLVFAGGLIALRDQILVRIRDEARAQQEGREKLAARIDTLQSALDSLSAQPKTDNGEALTALTAKLTEATARLDALNNRLETLEKKADEKKPEPVAVAPPPPAPVAPPVAPAPQADASALKLAALSGKPFTAELAGWVKQHPQSEPTLAPLHSFAADGIPGEADLLRQLRDILDAKPETQKPDDSSLVGKINMHLKGLVSIRKTEQADPLADLRKTMLHDDFTTVAQHVARLDMPAESPLGLWLQKARNRRDALAELDKLTPPPGE